MTATCPIRLRPRAVRPRARRRSRTCSCATSTSAGLATEPTAFDGRSDYGPFIEHGVAGRRSVHGCRGHQDRGAGGHLRRYRRLGLRPLLPPGVRHVHEPEPHGSRSERRMQSLTRHGRSRGRRAQSPRPRGPGRTRQGPSAASDTASTGSTRDRSWCVSRNGSNQACEGRPPSRPSREPSSQGASGQARIRSSWT